MGFPRQEYWSGLPFSSPGDLPNPGMEPMFSALVGAFFTSESLGKPQQRYIQSIKELSRAQENVHSLQCFMVIEFSCFSRCCVIWTTCLAQLKDTSLDLAFQNEEANKDWFLILSKTFFKNIVNGLLSLL